MSSRLAVTLAVPLIVFLAVAPPIRATVLLPAEFREIVGQSQIIAYGRVIDAVPEMSFDRKHIDTVVSFEVGTGRVVACCVSSFGTQLVKGRTLVLPASISTPMLNRP